MSYFHAKIQKNTYLHVFLDLVTSLVKPWEQRLYFKNTKNLFYFLLVSGIMNLYVRYIFDIK